MNASSPAIENAVFTLYRGSVPLLVSCPHDGTALPDDITARLKDKARRVPDTDWHVARLYDFGRELGASMLAPKFSRYVIDLNRPPDDASLYPGQNTTGLCPLLGFDGEAIYLDGQEPDDADIADRRERYWRPYHEALAAELARLKAEHGRAVLWEAHSIRGEVPFLFDGRLPDLNLGTATGTSCSAPRQTALESVLADQADFDWVANGRFKGGFITRNYGDPDNGIDAVQLEISQRCYMDEDRFAYDDTKALSLQRVLRRLLEATINGAVRE